MSKKRNGAVKKKMQRFKKKSILVCKYCKRPLSFDDATVDHKIPLSRGGKSIESNFAIACTECNGEKSNMTDEEYIKFKKEYKTIKIYNQEKAMEEARKDSRTIDVNKFFGRV